MIFKFLEDRSCIYCGQDPSEVAYLCKDCLKSLAFRPQLVHKKQEDILAGYLYSQRIRDLLTRYKFKDQRYLKTTLADLFAKTILEGFGPLDVQGFVVVPSSPRRKFIRGFDPMDWIGEEFEKIYGLTYYRQTLFKVKETPLQIQVPDGQRGANVEGVFHSRPLQGERLLLLDDILTTGATLVSAKKALVDAGAGQVLALSLAY